MAREDSGAMPRRSLLAVFLTALAVYLGSLANGFVWDDISHIVEPGPLQSLKNITLFFSTGVTSGASFAEAVPYYRPLSTLSLALDYAVWGGSPFGFHLTNILLHGFASLLAALTAFELLRDRNGALAAGLLFAVHPVHAEAVAYVAARNELLCVLFALAAFFCYCRCRQEHRWYWWPLMLLLFFASLLAKEMTITLPALIFLAEILCFRGSVLRAAVNTAPFALTAALYMLLRSAALLITSWESPPLDVRLATALTLTIDYLRLLLAPWPLRVLHDAPVRWGFGEPAVLVSGVLLTVLLFLLAASVRRLPLLTFGGAWLLITLLPVSGLPAFIQPALMAERYLYFPSVGFCLLAGLAVSRLQAIEKWHNRDSLLRTTVGLLLLCLALLAGWHGRHWHDQERLCKRMIADAPDHPLGYHELGNWYGRQQRYGEMASLYQRSLDLTMRQQDRLGKAYLARGEYARAEREYLKLVDARALNGSIHNSLGLALLGQGRSAEALEQFSLAVDFEPENAEFRSNLQRAGQGRER